MIIDSPIVSGSYAATGSLTQVGDVVITGSLTVTGPINGALTGSVDSASFASTASYTLNVSGTTNFISKFTNSNILSDSSLSDNSYILSYRGNGFKSLTVASTDSNANFRLESYNTNTGSDVGIKEMEIDGYYSSWNSYFGYNSSGGEWRLIGRPDSPLVNEFSRGRTEWWLPSLSANSGSFNIVPYYDTSKALLTVKANGKTGINNGDPSYNLDVSGSGNFTNGVTVTGSLITTGQIIAQTLNVQQVTSSIVYSSGSNIFGNNITNTHQFTGSVLVTGSVVANSVVRTGGTSTQYLMADGSVSTLTNPVVGTGVSGQVTVFNGTNSVTSYGSLNTNGVVFNINTNSNQSVGYTVKNDSTGIAAIAGLTAQNNNLAFLQIGVTGHQYNNGYLGTNSAFVQAGSNAYRLILATNNTSPIFFYTNATYRGSITTAGNYLIGIAAASDNGTDKLQVGGSGLFTGNITANSGGEAITLFNLAPNYATIRDKNSFDRIWFENTGGYRTIFDVPSSGSFAFRDNVGTIALTISNTGAVSIGGSLSGTTASFSSTLTTNGLVPTSARASNVGSAAIPYSDGYFGNTIEISKDGSNSVGGGPYITFGNLARNRFIIQQLNASNGIDYWYYNGSTWGSPIITFSNSGAATFSSIVTSGEITSNTTNGSFVLRNAGGVAGNNAIELNIRSNAGKSGYLTFTENAVADRWSVGIANGNSDLRFIPNFVTSSPVFTLSNAGAATFSSLGTGTVYSSGGTLTNTNPSDLNLKNTINNLSYGLNEIIQLQPKTFYYNDDTSKSNLKYGFIAQDVQEIMPDLVRPIGNGSSDLGLETEGIYATLVNAIKELKAENDTLKQILQRNNIN